MPKEISALNTYYIFYYLETHHPEVNLNQIVKNLTADEECYVENLQTGILEKVSITHLKSSRYWFSHIFVQRLYDLITEQIQDPRLAYKIGRSIYKTQPIIKSAIGIPLLGIHRVAHRVSIEAAKFNRTKRYEVVEKDKGYVVIRVTHLPHIVVNEFTRQWNAGILAAYAILAGARDISVDIETREDGPQKVDDPGRTIWQFTIRYKDPGFIYRISKAVIFNLPWVRELIEKAEEKEYEHTEQILHLDRVIKERTEKLIRIQEKLIAGEREIIESKLANLSLDMFNSEEVERKAIAKELNEGVAELLTVSRYHIQSVIKGQQDSSTLKEVDQYIQKAQDTLLSLTFQISPPVLYDFGLSAAISWIIDDLNSRYNMNFEFIDQMPQSLTPDYEYTIIFYRTVRELITNIIKQGQSTTALIELYTDNKNLKVSVFDKESSFDPNSLGNGIGLFPLRERIHNLRGQFVINAEKEGGTEITISMPLDVISS